LEAEVAAAGAPRVAVGAGAMKGALKGAAVKGVDSGGTGVDVGARVVEGQMVAAETRPPTS